MALAATMSPAEFLAQEREAEFRHEFLNGIVTEMPGGSLAHSLLKVEIVSLFAREGREKGFVITDSDLRVRIPEDGYVYPDAALTREVRLEDAHKDVLLNPIVIFEVLSPSTEKHDRTVKFDAYASIPSLKEYVLISSEERRVEVYRRSDEVWLYWAYRNGETAMVADGEIALSLDELYEGVD